MNLRDEFPTAARFGDHVRKHFPDARAIAAREGEKTWAATDVPEVAFPAIPDPAMQDRIRTRGKK